MSEASTWTVLLVEDNPGDALLLDEALQEAEMSVLRARRLSEALTHLPRATAVLLDLNLPDSRGIDTFKRVHDAAPRTPVVVLSGMDDLDLALEVVGIGAQDYLVKGEVTGSGVVRALHIAVKRASDEAGTSRRGRYRVLLGPGDDQGPHVRLEDAAEGGRVHTITRGNRSSLVYVLARQLDAAHGGARGATDGWVDDEDVAVGIWGRAAAERTLSSYYVLVHRLRKELAAAGFDPACIEKRRGAIRLRDAWVGPAPS